MLAGVIIIPQHHQVYILHTWVFETQETFQMFLFQDWKYIQI